MQWNMQWRWEQWSSIACSAVEVTEGLRNDRSDDLKKNEIAAVAVNDVPIGVQSWLVVAEGNRRCTGLRDSADGNKRRQRNHHSHCRHRVFDPTEKSVQVGNFHLGKVANFMASPRRV